MPLLEVAVGRPQRWDVPFGAMMRDEHVDRLLAIDPFRGIDADQFPAALPLRGILLNDTRIVDYPHESIVVREGDYGNSAFLVLKGRVKVVLDSLPPAVLGRPPAARRGLFNSLLRLWRNPRLPEVRRNFAAGKGVSQDPNQMHVFLQDVPRMIAGARVALLHAGEFFGELAALTRLPRSATVLADGDAQLLEIRWQGLRDLMRRTPALRQHIERLYRVNSLRVHLRETPLLAELPAERIEQVAAATEFETHGNFEWQAAFDSAAQRPPVDAIVNEPLIAEEGTPCDGLILVRSGFARLSPRYGHGHRTVAYLGKGQVYGMSEAILSARSGEPMPLANSLRALGYVDVLRVPQSVLAEHVFPHVPASLLDSHENRLTVSCTTHHCDLREGQPGGTTESVDTALLEFLVEERFINGSEAMVIDLDRCTRCDDCVRACAATHDNNPRFLRHGQRHGQYLVAHACMHCVDPVCMIGCPTGAIARETATGIVRINDQTCIGCSTCANSCPYDNIRMTEIRDSHGALLVDESTRQPLLKATKCDLCADHPGGPACQRACPHDALVRMDLGNLGELSQWVNR
jgi:Fe-S-cluster-containing dehydrogenase component/CRP-like cAMP-binding protein